MTAVFDIKHEVLMTNCPSCGKEQRTTLHKGRDLLGGVSGDFEIKECLACRLVSTFPVLDSAGMSKYYPDNYLPYYKALDEIRNPFLRWYRAKGVQRKCQIVLRNYSSIERKKILDIGSATGLFLYGMREHGWNVAGVEPSRFASDYAHQKYGIFIVNGFVNETNFPNESFDVITLWDVFEHLPNPNEVLEIAYKWIKPGGIIIITTPNTASWLRKRYQDNWAGWDTPRHYHIYNKNNLSAMLTRAGFDITKYLEGVGEFGHYLISMRFALEKKKSGTRGHRIVEWFLRSFLGKLILFPVFLIESVGKQKSSMTVIGRKDISLKDETQKEPE